MDMTVSKKKDDSDEYEDIIENQTLNSMVPLWKRNKKILLMKNIMISTKINLMILMIR